MSAEILLSRRNTIAQRFRMGGTEGQTFATQEFDYLTQTQVFILWSVLTLTNSTFTAALLCTCL